LSWPPYHSLGRLILFFHPNFSVLTSNTTSRMMDVLDETCWEKLSTTIVLRKSTTNLRAEWPVKRPVIESQCTIALNNVLLCLIGIMHLSCFWSICIMRCYQSSTSVNSLGMSFSGVRTLTKLSESGNGCIRIKQGCTQRIQML
jgi:hypothetical protein